MKIFKIVVISGIGVVCALALGVLLLHILYPPEKTDRKEDEYETVSADEVAVLAIAESEAVNIFEDPAESAEETVSEDEAETVSGDMTGSVSENEEPAVSDNGAVAAVEGEIVSVSADEAPQEPEEEPAEPTPEQAHDDTHEDTRAPFFLTYNGSPVIKLGDTFNIHKYMGYADDVDRNVDLEVTGEVNTAAEGTYPLSITLRDDAGRSVSQKMNVKVVAELPGSSGGGGNKEEFSDFISRYKTEETSVGIDISRWQETVDFEKVKAAGCEFVYMRIGGRDDGELYTDRYYLNNIAGAKAAGLKVGIYWHAEEGNAQQVKESVDYLMGVLNGVELDFPIAYDWEDFLNFENYGMNIYDLNNNLDVFVSEINARGYKACLYNSKYYLETVWSSAANHPLWLAHYVSSTNYKGNFFMWQHGCTGRIDGINGDVDLDVLYNNALAQL